MKVPATDEYWMSVALTAAGEGVGLTRPNPPVGAVVVKNGRAVGIGYHQKAGTPHAEIHALAEAGGKARGATLFCTLEPCSTTGRTPPCTDAIRAAGITRVVYGCDDPFPAHRGRAARILSGAGIKVTRQILEGPCRQLIEPFVFFHLHRRPRVVLKLACSLDGRIADRTGTSKWITGSSARDIVQDLRRASDAVLVGAGTLLADNPSLLPRPAWGHTPLRAVAAAGGPVPASARVFTDGRAEQTILYVSSLSKTARTAITAHGATIVDCRAAAGGVSLKQVLRDLHRRSCMQVLCEGGGQMAAALLRAGLVDELKMFYAMKWLGGDGLPAAGGRGWLLSRCPEFELSACEQTGNDVLVTATRRTA